MRIQDLHELPKFRDGLSYLYLEHGRIEQALKAVEFRDAEGTALVPVASLALLMLGPGTSITHEAIKTLADNGCLVTWVGEQGVRFYAQGSGETRKGYRLLRQAELVCNPQRREAVIRRMYAYRFGHEIEPGLSLEQVRGMEGARVRRGYADAARRWGVDWRGREYDRRFWRAADPVNRALSTANACLNGLCHAAILSAGYSPALGFVHTGKQLSFVYDVADLYKLELTVPLAFRLTAESTDALETRVRHACRDAFYAARLLGRIIDDIDRLLEMPKDVDEPGEAADADNADVDSADVDSADVDSDAALPGALWDPVAGPVEGGVNHGGADS